MIVINANYFLEKTSLKENWFAKYQAEEGHFIPNCYGLCNLIFVRLPS